MLQPIGLLDMLNAIGNNLNPQRSTSRDDATVDRLSSNAPINATDQRAIQFDELRTQNRQAFQADFG